MPFLKTLIQAHVLAAPVVPDSVLLNQPPALDVDKFNLAMKKMKYDVEVYEVWAAKCQTAKSAQEHKQLEVLSQAHASCRNAAMAQLRALALVLTYEGSVVEH